MPLALLGDRQYTAPSAADSVALTPTGVVWTNSAYVTLLDPTPAACVLTGVTLRSTDGTSSSVSYDLEVDIATGAAGSEVVIAPCAPITARSATPGRPAGRTIAACRSRSTISAAGPAGGAPPQNFEPHRPTVAITYSQKPLTATILTTAVPSKALPPAAAGTTVTAGGSAWANGTWGQLRTAAGAALVVIGVVFGTPSVIAEYELDLGTGGAGSETVITTIRLTAVSRGQPSVLMLPTPLDNVAASTRVAARLRCATASATMIVSLLVQEKPL